MKRILGLALALLMAVPVWAAAGKVEFADGKFPDGNVSATMNAGEFTEIYARAHFPKQLGKLKFDKMQVMFENVGGSGIYKGLTVAKADIGERWMNSNYMDFDVIAADGSSEFKDFNEYKPMTLDELTGAPKREGFAEQKVQLIVTLYSITGYSKKVVWDDFEKAWVEKKTPIFGKGNTISKGTLTIVQQESAVANGFEDRDSSWAVPYSDYLPKGSDVNDFSTPVTVNGFRTGREPDSILPVGYFFYGFGVETAKLPESQRTIEGLKASLAEAGVRNDMGWSYFIDGIRNMEGREAEIAYSPANIGGNNGERAIFLGKRAFAVLYLLQKGSYTYIYWFDLMSPPFSLYETDSKDTIWKEKFTDQQRQTYLGTFDSIAGSIKILK